MKKDIINKLLVIYEYDKSFFNYDELTNDRWEDLLVNAKKKFKIFFDLENNDSCKVQREITIPQNYWKYTECKFKCELYQAGGDWENPVYYFKIQIISGYCFNDNDSDNKRKLGRTSNTNSLFIFIPGKTEGNYQLVPGKTDGEWRAPNGNTHKKGIDPEPNEKDCWKSLEIYLKKLVDMEIEEISKNEEYSLKN